VPLPSGGGGGSGYGRFAGEEGLRGICNVKAVCRDRFRLLSTGIPAALDYPIRHLDQAWDMCSGIVALGYGIGLGDRVAGLWAVIRHG
jgi:hypothetical protein